MHTKRIAAGISYKGTAYHGWQKQQSPTVQSIQAACERAIGRIANHPVQITCAGRTDKGVHAIGQVVHFDTHAVRASHAWVSGANHYLPKDIAVTWALEVPHAFHARHCATSRVYHYFLYNAGVRPAPWIDNVSFYPGELSVPKMQKGATFLLGEHDFSAFRAADCQARSPVRTLHDLQILPAPPWIVVRVQANAFLHKMIRNIMGVLIAVGCGRCPPEWVRQVLHSCDRSKGGITAAPNGLYLMQVMYPSTWKIP